MIYSVSLLTFFCVKKRYRIRGEICVYIEGESSLRMSSFSFLPVTAVQGVKYLSLRPVVPQVNPAHEERLQVGHDDPGFMDDTRNVPSDSLTPTGHLGNDRSQPGYCALSRAVVTVECSSMQHLTNSSWAHHGLPPIDDAITLPVQSTGLHRGGTLLKSRYSIYLRVSRQSIRADNSSSMDHKLFRDSELRGQGRNQTRM